MRKDKLIVIGNPVGAGKESLIKALKEKGLTMEDVIVVDPKDKEVMKKLAEGELKKLEDSTKMLIKKAEEIEPIDIKTTPKEKKHPFEKFMKKKKR